MMRAARLVSVFGFIDYLCFVLGSDNYVSINWSPQNPIFIADGVKCAPGARKLKVQVESKVYFICPNIATVLRQSPFNPQASSMYENIWLLYNKTAFHDCDLSKDPETRLLLKCTSPSSLDFFSVIFTRHTADDNGLRFKEGRTYYFTATSDGTISGLNNTRGGHCSDARNNVYMKIEVYICWMSNRTYQDPECADGVGVVQCPAPPSRSQDIVTQQPVTTSIATTTTEATENNRSNIECHPEKSGRQPQTADNVNKEELKMWKTCAISAFAVASFCILLIILMTAWFWKHRMERKRCSSGGSFPVDLKNEN